MIEKTCPLFAVNFDSQVVLCIKERCQWWIGAYEREKGGSPNGRDRLMGTQNCAIVILAQKNAEGLIDD